MPMNPTKPLRIFMIVRFAKLPFVYIRMTVMQSGKLNSAGLRVERFEEDVSAVEMKSSIRLEYRYIRSGS